jgi:hypothetical protein
VVGEIVGLETEFARSGAIRVEHQLYQLDSGELIRCPPKDDSYRTIDAMDWLSALVANHVARTKPTPCPCHGKTYVRVEQAIVDLGFVRGGLVTQHAAHGRRNGFATWLFTPAVSGWYPKKAPQEARPVPLLSEPWPGVPARGRGASDRADACWLPIATLSVSLW